jgi:serine/threonine protein kinase/8-oxo-dGTP pyrophosphatase MutT (NUDIX family)
VALDFHADNLPEDYEIVGPSRRGTTSIVYPVKRETGLYALKVYTGNLWSDSRSRFLREAAFLCEFDHPNIVKGIRYGTIPRTDRPFLLMEFVEGKTLGELASHFATTGETFLTPLALSIVRQVASALAYARETFQVVHRDLKLENVMVRDADGAAKLIDFGLARKLGEELKLPSSWEFNAAPRYRSPEKWRDFHASDEASDIWSLGIILYHLLTGCFPFASPHDTGSEDDLRGQVLYVEPTPPSHIRESLSSEIDLLVSYLLSKNPRCRPTSAEVSAILGESGRVALSSIERLHAQRAKALSARRFDPNRAENVSEPILLYVPEYRVSLQDALRKSRQRALQRLVSVPVKWGPSETSTKRKVANICEILLAFDDSLLTDDTLVDAICEGTNWLIQQEQPTGYPSLSYNLVTTQCTALAALALRHVSSLKAVPKWLSTLAFEASTRAVKACRDLACDRGWGTWQQTTVRIQTTIWALRALCVDRLQHHHTIDRFFSQLRQMHTVGQPGCFGFRPGGEFKVSPTASFLLLCSDLEASGWQPDNVDRYYLEKYFAVKAVINSLRQRVCVPSEREIFFVDPVIVPRVGNVEQLTWHHVSQPLAVEALARHTALLGVSDDTLVWLNAAIDLYRRVSITGLMVDITLAEAGLHDAIFPTAYCCTALQALEQWLTAFDHLPKLPQPPPRPLIHRGLIRKSGAAIIRSGQLLLVRKYGTEQLIMPGGGIDENEDPLQALRRELGEELSAESFTVDERPIGTYRAEAAFEPSTEVEIVLFGVDLASEPRAAGEIEEIVWYRPGEAAGRLSPIIRRHILPDLISKGLLHESARGSGEPAA